MARRVAPSRPAGREREYGTWFDSFCSQSLRDTVIDPILIIEYDSLCERPGHSTTRRGAEVKVVGVWDADDAQGGFTRTFE